MATFKTHTTCTSDVIHFYVQSATTSKDSWSAYANGQGECPVGAEVLDQGALRVGEYSADSIPGGGAAGRQSQLAEPPL